MTRAAASEPQVCEWVLDEPDSDTWLTDCGHAFTLNDGTPSQNRMAFCCYCGAALKETPAESEEMAA